jgi:parallel beta-helix repeat protein
VQNGGNLSGAMGAGILLQNSNNCTITNNTVTNNYKGIVFDNSSDNVLKGNNIGDNMFNLVFLNASTTNNIDTSNIVDGKPYTNG